MDWIDRIAWFPEHPFYAMSVFSKLSCKQRSFLGKIMTSLASGSSKYAQGPAINIFYFANADFVGSLKRVEYLLSRIVNTSKMMTFEQEELREAWINQREALQVVLNTIDNIMDEMGSDCITKCSRKYRFKFASSHQPILRPHDRNFDESIIYIAEGLIRGYCPISKDMAIDMSNLVPLALSLMIAFVEICVELENKSTGKSEKVYKDAKEGSNHLIKKLESFDLKYIVFEQELLFLLSENFMPCPMSENVLEGRQIFGIFLNEGLDYGLNKKLIDEDDVSNYDPNIFITVPRMAVLQGCYLGWFKRVDEGEEFEDLNCERISFYLNPYFLPFYCNLNDLQERIEELSLGERELLEKRLVDLQEDHGNEILPTENLQQIYRDVSELAYSFQTGKYSGAFRELLSGIMRQRSYQNNKIECCCVKKVSSLSRLFCRQ